jgi:hypothetical protein
MDSLDEKTWFPNHGLNGGIQIFKTYPIFFWKSNKFIMWQVMWHQAKPLYGDQESLSEERLKSNLGRVWS